MVDDADLDALNYTGTTTITELVSHRFERLGISDEELIRKTLATTKSLLTVNIYADKVSTIESLTVKAVTAWADPPWSLPGGLIQLFQAVITPG